LKRVLSVFLAVVSLLFVCSCGGEGFTASKKYSLPEQIAVVPSGMVAENNNFVLTYDSSVDNLILFNKSTEQLVSTIPYKHYASTEETTPYVDGMLNSSIVISCINNKDSSVVDYSSYDSVILGGKAYSVLIDNGVRVIYFFEEPQISIPVDYTLTEKGLQAKILLGEVTEGSAYRVYKIKLLPYFASAENNTDSYLFIPSGSGALMYTDDDKRNIRMYSEAVYGTDATYDTVYKLNETQQVHLPVFGSKYKNQGIFAVINEGSELAYIEASAGDAQIGYSSVYSSFYVRGKDIAKIKNQHGANQVVNKIGTHKASTKSLSVEYTVLDDATYNGMADAYRSFLKSKGYFANGEKEGYLYLNILGGALVNKSFLGISYKTLKATTTVNQAKDIVSDVSSFADNGVVARLKGFGKGGLDKTVLAGGFKIDSAVGKKSQLKDLNDICTQKGIALAMDFDLIHFTKSGSGYSLKKDSARNLNNTTAKSNYYTLVTKQANTSVKASVLLKRGQITSASVKALDTITEYGLKGISLGSLSNVVYGDYSDQKYFVKANTVSDFEAISKNIKEKNIFTVCEKANSYAAVNADYVFGAPTKSSQYLALDKEVPFYQMVFKGNVSLSSPALNLEAEPKREFLKAVSTGSALQFAVISQFDTALISSVHSGLAGSVYSDIKNTIVDMYSKATPFLQRVNGAQIKSYTEEKGVSCTEFDNGVKVYVNFTEKAVSTPLGSVEPNDFIFS